MVWTLQLFFIFNRLAKEEEEKKKKNSNPLLLQNCFGLKKKKDFEKNLQQTGSSLTRKHSRDPSSSASDVLYAISRENSQQLRSQCHKFKQIFQPQLKWHVALTDV